MLHKTQQALTIFFFLSKLYPGYWTEFSDFQKWLVVLFYMTDGWLDTSLCTHDLGQDSPIQTSCSDNTELNIIYIYLYWPCWTRLGKPWRFSFFLLSCAYWNEFSDFQKWLLIAMFNPVVAYINFLLNLCNVRNKFLKKSLFCVSISLL